MEAAQTLSTEAFTQAPTRAPAGVLAEVVGGRRIPACGRGVRHPSRAYTRVWNNKTRRY